MSTLPRALTKCSCHQGCVVWSDLWALCCGCDRQGHLPGVPGTLHPDWQTDCHSSGCHEGLCWPLWVTWNARQCGELYCAPGHHQSGYSSGMFRASPVWIFIRYVESITSLDIHWVCWMRHQSGFSSGMLKASPVWVVVRYIESITNLDIYQVCREHY